MKVKYLLLSCLLAIVIGACSNDDQTAESIDDANIESVEQVEESEVSEEKMKELEDVQSTNDSLRQLEQEIDQFIESLNE